MNLDELERLARAATPGPWKSLRNQGNRWTAYKETANVIGQKDDEGSTEKICLVNGGNIDNAAFIASANPAVILALIERLESAEEIVRAFTGDPHIGHIQAARAHMEKHLAKP